MWKILLVLMVVTLLGCNNIVCNEPYIREGDGCCLDQDDDKVCDEVVKDTPQESITEEPTESVVENTTIEEPPATEPIKEEEKNVDFMIGYDPLKNEIRLLDQAIIQMEVRNYGDDTQTYLINIDDPRFDVRSNPYMEPLRIGVKAKGVNYFKLIIQPDREYISGPGEYSIAVDILEESTKEMLSIDIPIIIK